MNWLLLIYTLPSEPTRKRAHVWRELKKAGGVYLRDGVCALPQRADTTTLLRDLSDRIEEFGGEATLIESVELAARRSELIEAQSLADRAEEYGEIAREAERFLEHVVRETEHRAFTFGELSEMEADLGKLRRWTEQVRSRDYFQAEGRERVESLLSSCEEKLAELIEGAPMPEGFAR